MNKNRILSAIISMILCVTLFVCCVSPAFALTPSDTTTDEERNRIAWTWNFLEQGYKEYNCLAWALGNTTVWVWPWGARNPTLEEVDAYMARMNYVALDSAISCHIYAYGSEDAVVHFARSRGDGPLAVPIDAKWGSCELFTHGSTNPYNSIASGGAYGSRVRGYRK